MNETKKVLENPKNCLYKQDVCKVLDEVRDVLYRAEMKIELLMIWFEITI